MTTNHTFVVGESAQAELQSLSVDSLSNSELLAMFLEGRVGQDGLSQLSREIFALCSGRALSPVGADEISIRCGLDPGDAAKLAAALELAKRLLWPDDGRRPIRSPQDVCQAAAGICSANKEHFLVLYLDARNLVTYQEVVSIGSLNANIVHPREVFRPAISQGAAALILVHNHPSGDISPSQEDLDLTARLSEAGRLLGIEVLDHVIVSGRRFLSFKSESYLP